MVADERKRHLENGRAYPSAMEVRPMSRLVNVALASEGAVAVADSEFQGASYQRAGGLVKFVNDGVHLAPGDDAGAPLWIEASEANRWVPSISDPHPHWVWIRFRQRARISRVVVHRADIADYPVDFAGEYSPDGGLTLRTLFEVTGNRMDDETFAVARSFEPVVTDNFRLRIDRSSDEAHPDETELSEIEVFGSFVDEDATVETAAQAPSLPDPLLAPTEQDYRFFRTRLLKDHIEFSSRWLRLAVARHHPQITALCWDSLGKGHLMANLVKGGEDGGVRLIAKALFAEESPLTLGGEAVCEGNVVRYELDCPDGGRARWEIRVEERSVQMVVSVATARESVFAVPPALKFAFDIMPTPTAPIANPRPGLAAPLPCLLHASDYGSLLVRRTDGGASALKGQRTRSDRRWDARIIDQTNHRPSDGLYLVPPGVSCSEFFLSVETVKPVPALTDADARLETLPRHWLNNFQYRDDIGILSNNIISANAITTCMLHFIEPAIFTPPMPGGVEAIHVARETLDRYFAGARGYGTEGDDPWIFLDSYPCLLSSAWAVIRVTGDMELLTRWLPLLEGYAARIKEQDRDGNGFPESIKPGTPSDKCRSPHANIADQLNFGHEDAYSSALIYRALGYLADLERLAGRPERAGPYERDAERIRAGYMEKFFNPETGIIAGWRDRDGRLHDYWFPWVNGAAITYGLVGDDEANAIVDRLEAKMREVGYDRFDLGLPICLIPIRKEDYGNLSLDGLPAMGTSLKEDGSDGFGDFANGGTGALLAYWYIQALYQLGRREEADRILWPMMKRYAAGDYQNREKPTSASGGYGTGLEFMHWNGTPSGYEGFLADSYFAQMALFTGYYGIGLHPEGFRLEPWSPLAGKRVKLGLKYMGDVVEELGDAE